MNAAVPNLTTATVPTSPHVMNTYGRLPIAMSHGQGSRVWDVNGKCYLDALGGIAVNTLGHGHPKLVPALQDQIAKLIHTSNYYHVPGQEALAAKLVALSGLTNVFFCSTGLEANEAALKLARKFGHDKGIERPEIVVYEKAFHGRSIATLSATGNPKVQAGFGPLVEGFIRVPINNIDQLKAATANNPNVVAVFFEAIQGEGGVNPMHMDYLRDVRALCDERGWLLMIDEVQCGMGRTGKWFAHQWAGIQPDGGGGAESRDHFPAGQPRHHLWRQPAGHAGGHRDHPHHGRRWLDRQRGTRRRPPESRPGPRVGRCRRGEGNPRHGPDAGHRSVKTLRCVGATLRRRRPAGQRDGRHGGAPGATADPDHCRGR